MAVELDHPFSTSKPIDESYATVLDLEREMLQDCAAVVTEAHVVEGQNGSRHHPPLSACNIGR